MGYPSVSGLVIILIIIPILGRGWGFFDESESTQEIGYAQHDAERYEAAQDI
jgi:hypothetical protein